MQTHHLQELGQFQASCSQDTRSSQAHVDTTRHRLGPESTGCHHTTRTRASPCPSAWRDRDPRLAPTSPRCEPARRPAGGATRKRTISAFSWLFSQGRLQAASKAGSPLAPGAARWHRRRAGTHAAPGRLRGRSSCSHAAPTRHRQRLQGKANGPALPLHGNDWRNRFSSIKIIQNFF